jgi:hypothetical protein
MDERMFETTKGSIDLRRLLLHHQEMLLANLGARELFDHPTAKGDIGEGAWRDLLEKFLPRRYQVSKAFVLDAHGATSEQIDVVIHDRHFCPILFEQDDQRYIPAESVFAVFEVRPALDRGVIEYAAKKARSVRRLHRTSREMVDRGEVQPPREPFNIIAGVLTVRSDWSPPFGDSLIDALSVADPDGRLQLGCAPADGAFEAVYEAGRPQLEVSEDGGALLFFLMRLFHHLQMIGSPMAIDLREYTRPLEDAHLDAAEATS